MNKKSKKQEILEAALNLFSVQGYEATSISQIADAVGIKKASMYSHFSGKQEILDTMLQRGLEEYNKRSIFSKDIINSLNLKNENIATNSIMQMIIGQVKYIIHDPYISKSRKMLTIEQFRNSKLKDLLTKQNYTDVMDFFIKLVRFLTDEKIIMSDNIEITAAQLCLPITTLIGLCDREPEREAEIIKLIENHIRQFLKIYKPI